MKKIITLLVAITLAGTSLAQEDKDTWNLGDLYPSVEVVLVHSIPCFPPLV